MSGISLLILNHSKVAKAKAQWFEKATIIIPLIHPLYRKPLMWGGPRLGTPGFSRDRELTLIQQRVDINLGWHCLIWIEATPLGCPQNKIKPTTNSIVFLMNTTKHHGDVKSQTPQKHVVFFLWNLELARCIYTTWQDANSTSTLLKCPHQSDGSGRMLPTERILLPG